MEVKKILITDAAIDVIDQLKDRFGPLMFHQSGGCCDGSSPMCFEDGDFKVGESDMFLGNIYGCPFYMSLDQYQYWKHTQLILDVTPGRGSSFSIEIPMGIRFLIRSRLFTMEEIKALEIQDRNTLT
jgi:uncharacterized protein (DUF779 family)